jgi:hypothetical protein
MEGGTIIENKAYFDDETAACNDRHTGLIDIKCPERLTSQEITALVQAVQAGQMSQETFIHNLQQE